MQNQQAEIRNIKIKQYPVLDFIDLLSKNNKRMLEFIHGNTEPLSEDKINKIKEIRDALARLKIYVETNTLGSNIDNVVEAREKYQKTRKKLYVLAKEGSIESIMHTDFSAIMDF